MIDERYSLEVFLKQAENSEANESLIDQLSQEIQNELHLVLSKKVEDIVNKLNAMGHSLKPYTEPLPGDINYRDDSNNNGYVCNLRLGVDTIISVGFQDTVDSVDD